jgi:tetratricopeptide (TPR) repeat protein
MDVRQLLDSAVAFHSEGKLEEAESIYKKILDELPDDVNALHLLGIIEYQRGKYESAVQLIQKAIKNYPNAIFYGNLGMVYNALEKENESVENFEKALELNPEYPNSYLANYNLGISYKSNGEFDKALVHYNKAIEKNKDFFDAYWNRGVLLLLLGKLKEGFEDYEYRFKKSKPTDSRIFDKPKWNGESLEDKKILIVAEQGFGDDIQFARFIPLVKKLGAYVILECKKGLRNLFGVSSFIDEFVDKEEIARTNFDFYIHLMSLPKLLGIDLTNIPNSPYIQIQKENSEKYRLNFPEFKIGINWAGNPEYPEDKERSTIFETFRCLEEIPGVKLFSLQKGEPLKQVQNSNVIRLSDNINDFSDTAGIIDNLDLVISTDTSVVHLAGAMGKPVWVLLSHIPDWRWLLERKDSPWYPSMKLFRQKEKGNWNSVMEEVVGELKRLIEN